MFLNVLDVPEYLITAPMDDSSDKSLKMNNLGVLALVSCSLSDEQLPQQAPLDVAVAPSSAPGPVLRKDVNRKMSLLVTWGGGSWQVKSS